MGSPGNERDPSESAYKPDAKPWLTRVPCMHGGSLLRSSAKATIGRLKRLKRYFSSANTDKKGLRSPSKLEALDYYFFVLIIFTSVLFFLFVWGSDCTVY